MPETRFYAPGFSLKLGGQELSSLGLVANQISLEQSVEASAHLSFSLFRAGSPQTLSTWFEEVLSFLRLGLPIEVRAGYGGERLLLFKGCLTSFSYAFSVDSIGEVQVEAQDFLFLLMKGKALRTKGQDGFSEVYDHDVVRRVLHHYPAFEKVLIDQTKIKYPKIQQKKEEHDYQFLKRLAERNGYLLYARVDQREEKAVFCFVRPPQKTEKAHQLAFGRLLRSFNPRFNLTQVITKVVVRGWDPVHKKEIEAKAELPREEVLRLEETKMLTPSTLEVHHPVRSQKEALLRARALLNRHRALLEAEAEVLGLPEIQAGDLVKIEGLPVCEGPQGTNLCSSYLVTQASHQIGEAGYRLRLKLKEVVSLDDRP